MFSEIIFGKKISEVTLEDLQSFFSEGQEESSILEFKSGGVSVDGVYKEVCAFLNTQGGILIIGTPLEEKIKPTKKTEVTVCKGELTPSNFRGKDWLMMSIVSNISPPPSNIKIQEFHTDKGSHFIVEVPQSMTPPHQTGDGRYYIRIERDSAPAPHGVVEALFFKRQKPKLRLNFNLDEINDRSKMFVMTIGNISPYPTEKVSYTVQLMNIESVNSFTAGEGVSESAGMHIVNYTTDQVLWKGLFMNPKFVIHHFDLPFYISVMTWSRDAELTSFVGIYDPAEGKFLEKENSSTENKKGELYYQDKVRKYIEE